jgi:hypothetical protein
MNSIRWIFLEPLNERLRIAADQIRPATGGKDKQFFHDSLTLVDSSYFLSSETSITCRISKKSRIFEIFR